MWIVPETKYIEGVVKVTIKPIDSKLGVVGLDTKGPDDSRQLEVIAMNKDLINFSPSDRVVVILDGNNTLQSITKID